MKKLLDSIESIVDNIEADEKISVVINFKDKDVENSLSASAKLAEIEMFGGVDTLQVSDHLETIPKRRNSRSARLTSLKKRNVKKIAKLANSIGGSGLERITSKKAALRKDLWIAGAYHANLDRETVASLRKNTGLVESVMLDAIVETPKVFISGSHDEIDDSVWGVSYVDAPEAWITGTRGEGIKISVIDLSLIHI